MIDFKEIRRDSIDRTHLRKHGKCSFTGVGSRAGFGCLCNIVRAIKAT